MLIWNTARPWLVALLLAALVAYNLAVFLPPRLQEMVGLYGIERSDMDAFLTPEAQALTPALVIVHPERWMPYGALLELEDPYLTTPFILAYSRGPEIDAQLARQFPERAVYHYYPDEPYVFYGSPRE